MGGTAKNCFLSGCIICIATLRVAAFQHRVTSTGGSKQKVPEQFQTQLHAYRADMCFASLTLRTPQPGLQWLYQEKYGCSPKMVKKPTPVSLCLSLLWAPSQQWTCSPLSRGKDRGMEGWCQTGVARVRRALKHKLPGKATGHGMGKRRRDGRRARAPLNPGFSRTEESSALCLQHRESCAGQRPRGQRCSPRAIPFPRHTADGIRQPALHVNGDGSDVHHFQAQPIPTSHVIFHNVFPHWPST